MSVLEAFRVNGEMLMPLWEYRRLDLTDVPRRSDDVDMLNRAGNEGWELVGITTNNVPYLKRLVEEVA